MISQKQFWSNIQYNLFFYNIIFIGSEYYNTNINNGTINRIKTVQRHAFYTFYFLHFTFYTFCTFYTSVINDQNKLFTTNVKLSMSLFSGDVFSSGVFGVLTPHEIFSPDLLVVVLLDVFLSHDVLVPEALDCLFVSSSAPYVLPCILPSSSHFRL